MARVPLVEKDKAPSEVREVFQKIEDNGARILNLYKTVANSPNLLLNFIRLGNAVMGKTKVPPNLRELAILRVAKITGSEYEWAQHAPLALATGLNEKQLDAIPDWKKSTEFEDREKAVLQYTDEVAQSVKVTDQTFNRLKKFFDEQTIVELTIAIGFYGMVARLLVPLQVEIDESAGSVGNLLGKAK